MTTEIERHFSAFKGEMNNHFSFTKGYRFLDLTLGDGGHTEEALLAGCQVVSFDIDEESISRAKNFLKDICSPLIIEDYSQYKESIPEETQWIVIKSNFINCLEAIDKLNIKHFDGVLIDLGPSQYQVLTNSRGFSFNSEDELDMRLNKELGVTAKDLVNALNEGELSRLFALGDEPFAKPIARIIASQRKISPIVTGKQLADLVSKVKHKLHSAIHPATQVFMTLRMAVNLERENISTVIPLLPKVLNTRGILGIISFHSVEDRLVKEEIAKLEQENIVSVINNKPFVPSSEELKISSRTRSAKLRLAKKNN